MTPSKSKNPEYIQVSGYISRQKAIKFRAYCKAKEIEISEVLEKLIDQWLEEQGNPLD
ncbi:plasmid partition protein ParG [Nostoc commune]|uniref:plasmid partition protein ParG n=1 Tax=Nostoc commune TaxID=1178 RepID=UPI0018C4AD23|nr:plasmid partition protein ParG [Nostoc commune]MBG1258424.1 hypothetical protein [Nostoc commune BAE]